MTGLNETIRELSMAEVDQVAGAMHLQIGRVYVNIAQGDILFGFGVKGAFDVSVFSDGDVRGHVG